MAGPVYIHVYIHGSTSLVSELRNKCNSYAGMLFTATFMPMKTT